jgi:hypothetical protein
MEEIKMFVKKKMLSALLALLILAALAACGGDGGVVWGNGLWRFDLDGTWIADPTGDWGNESMIFYGNEFQVIGPNSRIAGTFSSIGDEIKFVLSDGSIRVLCFSRTENTITIGGTQYTRNTRNACFHCNAPAMS